MSEIRFTLNGEGVTARDFDPHVTLLAWLRERGLTGTKEGCAEGECGACAVVLVRPRHDGRTVFYPVNACLLLLGSCADQEILTVEGVRDRQLHPVQEAMVRLGGSQCGYCTPGFVMSLFAEHYRPERATEGFDEESIAGNLCRCTGYRPIREAGKSLPRVAPGDAHADRLSLPAPVLRSLSYEHKFYRPSSLAEALAIRTADPELTIVCGGTDLVVEANQRHRRFPGLLSLELVKEMLRIDETEGAITIGASVPLSEVEARLRTKVPIFGQLLSLFSSRLIRNRATLGGNLCTASPIGDSPPVLLALRAEVVLASARGERVVPLDDFFTGYRQTALAKDELMVAVRVPLPVAPIARFYKVSKRHHDDISSVAAGFALDIRKAKVHSARLAYGGVAATPARATEAEAHLIGKPWSEATMKSTLPLLARAFAPMTDQRASAEYRAAMVPRLFEKLWIDTGSEVGSDAAGGAP